MIMWPKLVTLAFPPKKFSKLHLNKYLIKKTRLFEGWSYFNLNNLGLVLSMALKFCSIVTKVLKLKVRKFWGIALGNWQEHGGEGSFWK